MDASLGSFGCKHYKRSVKLVAGCCKKTYYCRLCHDENENHSLNRNEVRVVECVSCGLKQKTSERCSKCRILFGKYSCLVCNLFDNEDKNQFHCDDCGICRIGGKENYFHCQKCNLCLNKRILSTHSCIENASRGDCPICLLNLHTSREPLKVLACGHLLHEECYNSLLEFHRSECPVCKVKFTQTLDYAGKPF